MKLRPFELALVVIFLGLIVISLVFLSMYKGGGDDEDVQQIGIVTIWGTLPEAEMSGYLRSLADSNEQYEGVSYRSIPEDQFDSRLVNALADGTGPDIVFISHERLASIRKRVQPISYEAFPVRDIRSTYIDGAQIFALSDGLYAYPVALDPLVMYWNKNILSQDGFLEAPDTWEVLVNDYLPTLIRRNPDRSITRSVVAMGEYENVENSFGIISALLLQGGMVGVTESGTNYEIALTQSVGGGGDPLRASADFYTRFSRPNNSLYSWNRSFNGDRDRFLSEELAFYFGYGSEGVALEQQNPNLNFDIAAFPQGAAATVDRTYAKFYGLAALRTSKNLPGASVVMNQLASQQNAQAIADMYRLVPAHRASVSAGSNDVYGRINYKSAPIAYGWLNPRREAIDSIFNTMTKDINENRGDIDSVLGDVTGKLKLEYNQ